MSVANTCSKQVKFHIVLELNPKEEDPQSMYVAKETKL